MDAVTMTAITDQISSVEADIITIGGAILVLAAIALGVRWLKAQFF